MFGLVRNAVVIGTIAYFSPVHDQTPEARLAALRADPGAAAAGLAAGAVSAAPRLALEAASHLDAETRDALTRKIAAVAFGATPQAGGSPQKAAAERKTPPHP